MKLTYLGTAAAEGWPSVFCNCDSCQRARALGGKNIRTRSQAMVNEDMLIDFPCDSYMHMLHGGLDFSAVRYLLVTHSHTDHFYPAEFVLRGGGYAHNMHSEKLHIYCNAAVRDYFFKAAQHELEAVIEQNLVFHIVRPFEPFTAGDYHITPLPAKHMNTEQALIYLIEHEGRTLLYAHDTGRFYPQVYDYLQKNHVQLHTASLDCTSGRLENGEDGGHMSVPDDIVVKQRLLQAGIATPQTVFVMNHFSHNGGLLHDELCRRGAEAGMLTAYDGMEITI